MAFRQFSAAATAIVALALATPAHALAMAKASDARLAKGEGGPLEGIPIANVKLLDAANAQVPNVPIGFFGATDVDPNQLMATAFAGRSRVALLDVPPGAYTLKVTFTVNGAPVSTTAPILATADGAVLALTKP
jgi:hypothetical protein